MKLIFEHQANLGIANYASAVNMPDNSVWLFFEENERLMAAQWKSDMSDLDWANPDFENPILATSDKNLKFSKLKNVPRVGIFGSWIQDEIFENGNLVSPHRHRLAIWDAENDITKFLQTGSIQMDLDNIISSAYFTFTNPNQYLSGEKVSRIIPSKKIELYFTLGDSEDYPMGVFYIDSVSMSTNTDVVTTDCRSIAGKKLKDITMNAHYKYPKQVYANMVQDFLEKANIENFDIQQPPDPSTAWQIGLQFPIEMDRLTGLYEMIKVSKNWVVRETLDGAIIAGSIVSYDPIKEMYSTYQFERGKDLFSRSVTRDDRDVYGTVCYVSKHHEIIEDEEIETVIRKYVRVEDQFEVARHKTLFLSAPDDTPEEELEELAEELASRMSKAGIMEDFEGPFRPYIIPGDEAEIFSSEYFDYIGIITSVTHEFGDNGFTTAFTVDSAGVINKPSLNDMISKATLSYDNTIKRLK